MTLNRTWLVHVSTNGTYQNYVLQDYLRLDYSSVGLSKMGSTYRDPCMGTTAPLLGVTDPYTGVQYCTDGTLTNPGGIYTGLKNSAILNLGDPLIFNNTLDIVGFDVYAQSYAFASYSYQNLSTPANLTHVSFDQLISTNIPTFGFPYFACAYNWAEAITNDAAKPPSSPTYCSNVVPTWYTSKTH